MEKLIDELKKLVPFKDSTEAGDVVLIAFKKQNQIVHAVVREIVRDTTKRDEWWHVGLQFLTVPSRQATWTLRTAQFTGMEVFGMGDEDLFMKAVDVQLPPAEGTESTESAPLRGTAERKVVDIGELRKKREKR